MLFLQVFSGAMLALAAMTVLSAAIGGAAPNLVSIPTIQDLTSVSVRSTTIIL